MNSKKFIKSVSRFCRSVFFSAVFSGLLLTTAFAAPGDPDYSFGSGGTVLTEFEQGASAEVVLVQPDNKIIVAGTLINPGPPLNRDFVVMRLNADGSLDTSFGDQGKVFTSISALDEARTGALQADGKIVIGGESGAQFALIRFNTDGSLDTTFGSGGKVTTFITATDGALMHSVMIQKDGKIVAMGDNSLDVYLLRHNADGTPDASFGNGGKVTTRFVSEGNQGKSAALQADGKILVGGAVYRNATAYDTAIFRYNTDGTLDTTFDGDGAAIYTLSGGHDLIKEILIRPDGKILSVGTAVVPGQFVLSYAIGVYHADGTPDASFGSDGFAILPQTGRTVIEDALLQPDGKIVVVGTKTSPSGDRWRFHAARFNENGTFDFTFGNGGKVNLPVGYESGGFGLAVQPDNKILLAGFGTYPGLRKQQFAVSRLQGGNGTVPASATITGQVIDDFSRRGVGGVQVVLTSGSLSAPVIVRTNPFGFYRFPDLPVNTLYNLRIETKKRSTFKTSLTNVLLNGNEFAEDLFFRYSGSNTPGLQ